MFLRIDTLQINMMYLIVKYLSRYRGMFLLRDNTFDESTLSYFRGVSLSLYLPSVSPQQEVITWEHDPNNMSGTVSANFSLALYLL